MKSPEQQLKSISDKLQQLLKDHAAIKKENTRLSEALKTSLEKNAEQQKGLDILKQQLDIIKLGAGEMNEQDKKEFEKRINTYLKEIDRCITLLGE
jgi:hypothetical protein